MTRDLAVWTLAHRDYSGGGRLDVWVYPTRDAALAAGADLAMQARLDEDPQAAALFVATRNAEVLDRYEQTHPDTPVLRCRPNFCSQTIRGDVLPALVTLCQAQVSSASVSGYPAPGLRTLRLVTSRDHRARDLSMLGGASAPGRQRDSSALVSRLAGHIRAAKTTVQTYF